MESREHIAPSDELILSEAIRFVEEGVKVTFPVRGRSMLPFIVGGRDSVVLEKPKSLRVGNVVLAWVDGSRYVVHRVIALSGENVTLMGDGNLGQTESCLLQDVKAVATHVMVSGIKKRPLDAGWRRKAAYLWKRLLPARRYLLFIYRKTHPTLPQR